VIAEPAPVWGNANPLDAQCCEFLSAVAASLYPCWDRVEDRVQKQLEAAGFNPLHRRALSAITMGAASRCLGRGDTQAAFFEEVGYQGRRLAKLNVAPAEIVKALGLYEKVLVPVLRRHAGAAMKDFGAVREQYHFNVLLTVNNAYYEVREGESKTFFDLFWAELETRRLDELLSRFLAALSSYCKADQAQLFLVERESQVLVQRACHGAKMAGLGAEVQRGHAVAVCAAAGSQAKRKPRPLDPSWRDQFETFWSVPLLADHRLVGVLQFAFSKPYEWLPREQEMLSAAADRIRMAIDKQKLVEHLHQQQDQIRRLAESMMHVEEAERRRISRELHDQTGQDLLWIRLQMEMIERELPDGERQWRTRLSEVRDMTERTIIEVRRLIGALSPAVLDQLGLAAAIRQLANRYRQTHTAKVRLQIGRLPRLTQQLEVITYRLVQECLHNASKHSLCSRLSISLSATDTLLRLHVEDDGVGFRVPDGLSKPGSFGLAGIQERVALLGGECRIESIPVQTQSRHAGVGSRRKAECGKSSSGTKIYVELPISRGDHAKTPTVANPGLAELETRMFSKL